MKKHGRLWDRLVRWAPRGFTLVELLVVIGIIAVLISILLPTLSGVRRQAKLSQCSSNMRQVAMAMIMYINDNKGVHPPATVFPNTLDAQGPPGMITTRRPQVRYRQDFNENWVGAIALEDPTTELTTPAGVTGFDTSPLPDLAGHVRWNQDWGHLQMGAVLRYLEFDPAAGGRENDLGYGLNLSGSFKTIKLDEKHTDSFLFQVAGGDGIARYINDTGGLGLDGVIVAPGADLDTLSAVAGMLAYQHWWDAKWGSTIGYSVVMLDDEAGQAGTDYQSGQYGVFNLRYYPTERVMLGGEVLYGVREDVDGNNGDDLRLQFSAQYKF